MSEMHAALVIWELALRERDRAGSAALDTADPLADKTFAIACRAHERAEAQLRRIAAAALYRVTERQAVT